MATSLASLCCSNPCNIKELQSALDNNRNLLTDLTKGPLKGKYPSRCSALHLAAISGDDDAILCILKHDPSLAKRKNGNGDQPISCYFASDRKERSAEVVREFVQLSDLSHCNLSNMNPFHYIASLQGSDHLKAALNQSFSLSKRHQQAARQSLLANGLLTPIIEIAFSYFDKNPLDIVSTFAKLTPLDYAIISTNRKAVAILRENTDLSIAAGGETLQQKLERFDRLHPASTFSTEPFDDETVHVDRDDPCSIM